MAKRTDWYLNTEWNSAIETQFFEKLGRARRNRPMYLKYQAGELASTHPEAALALLERYFDLGENDSLAFLYQARAYRKLGEVEEAICSLQRALQRERENPYALTRAWSDYALLVAEQRREDLYDDALKVLREVQIKRKSEFVLPDGLFLWNAAHALIFAAQGRAELAKEHGTQALEAAALTSTGLRYHRDFGLVGPQYENIKAELQRMLSDTPVETVKGSVRSLLKRFGQ